MVDTTRPINILRIPPSGRVDRSEDSAWAPRPGIRSWPETSAPERGRPENATQAPRGEPIGSPFDPPSP